MPRVPSLSVTARPMVLTAGLCLDFAGLQIAGHFSIVSSGRILSETLKLAASRVLSNLVINEGDSLSFAASSKLKSGWDIA